MFASRVIDEMLTDLGDDFDVVAAVAASMSAGSWISRDCLILALFARAVVADAHIGNPYVLRRWILLEDGQLCDVSCDGLLFALPPSLLWIVPVQTVLESAMTSNDRRTCLVEKHSTIDNINVTRRRRIFQRLSRNRLVERGQQ